MVLWISEDFAYFLKILKCLRFSQSLKFCQILRFRDFLNFADFDFLAKCKTRQNSVVLRISRILHIFEDAKIFVGFANHL